ncbi:DUF1000-domain-containing protein [Suhomyces tanzawaensis NRRL Y-17324]|uniref:DUF1000-domain-containing protein n=1 Tax=Suhomyces tanzawaensis NRRL Y-17324 TaxID=984487 RepID=A0A1E4SQT3_9ASCO|nr:DUF1000-domain-containing protein [Suhomyces tanzawaensis NRRL Y-17324]ODV81772.1 DUF1000-domain-containing protein [Suhomyces tanzawaensis NRRL Y-17324]
MSCEHEHTHSHGHGHGHDDSDHSHVAPIPTSAAQSLLGKIDLPHITALNAANPPDEISQIFRKPESKYVIKPIVKSDCDSQLILNIPFLNASIKLFSIILRTNGEDHCPKTIKLFKNDNLVDFDNVESKKATFELHHPHVGARYEDDDVPESLEEEDSFVEHFLPRHVFTGVQQLTVFVKDVYDEEGEGDEDGESHLLYIELRGEFTELSRDPVVTIYESAANPADHKNLMMEESMNYQMN